MHDFAYSRPATLPAARALLAADPAAKPLAGGQTLVPVLKQRLAQPSQIVDLGALGLTSIRAEPGRIVVGAMATHAAIAADPAIRAAIPGLAALAGAIGDAQVRNWGTVGGSLANNDPSACHPAAALALGATIITDRRDIAADAFFRGMFLTALAPGELIVAVAYPVPRRSAYEKFRHPASRYAMAGVFVAEGPACVRVAVTGASQGGVFRHTAMEQALARDWSADALAGVETPADNMIGDIFGSPAYRAHLVGVMARRAVAQAG